MDHQNALIIIPTYNERENILQLLPAVQQSLPGVHVLVVDDNSPDGTSQIVKEYAANRSDTFILDRPKKDGLGRAYIAGFKWALERTYEFIFEMDADFSHDPRYLPDFIRMIEHNDLVIGSRYVSGVNVVNWPMSRLLLSYGANFMIRTLFGFPVRDATAGFKCFRRSTLQALNFSSIGSSGYSFQIEVNYMVLKRGLRIAETPIVFTDRQRGVSKMSSKIIREALFLLWKLRIRSLFSPRR